MAAPKLPSEFKSLYRLFLRTCSASVLHHPPATRNLRSLYRPSFETGAKVIKQLQEGSKETTWYTHRKEWLEKWNQRIDHTLALLYSSSGSRGLPHQLTRNLGLLVFSERHRLWRREHGYNSWSPRLPSDSQEYIYGKSHKKREAKQENNREFDAKAWSVVSEVIKMAEGCDEIFLGRVAHLKRPLKKVT